MNNSKAVSDHIEKVLQTKFPDVLSKYTNQNSHSYEVYFPRRIEDKLEIKLVLHVRNTGMKYTIILPCSIENARLERLEKMR